MSLVVTVYVPSGIVMAADSRMTVLRSEEREEDGRKVKVQQQIVLSDNAYKAVALSSIGVGISVYDAGVINNQPVDSHVHRFEEEAITPEDDVVSCGEKFLSYFKTNHPNVPIGFHVAGFWAAFLGALVISIVSVLLSPVIKEKDEDQRHD